MLLLIVGLACNKSSGPAPPVVSVETLDSSMQELLRRSRTAVESDAASPDAWGRLGQVFHALEFLPEARICYERAAALDPKTPRWPHLLGLTRLQDEPEAAIGLLAKAAELAGNDPDICRVRLIQALVERGRFEEAVRWIDRLLAGNPVHPMARLELGRIQLARNDLDRAAESLAPCLTNAFTRRPAMLVMGQVRQRQGDSTSAAQLTGEASAMARPLDWPDPFLREVQALRIDRSQAAEQINALLVRGRLGEAAVGLERLLGAFPNDPEGLLLLGRLRYLEKRCLEAEEALRRHLSLQANSVNGLMQLSLSLLCQERWPESVTTLRQVLLIKPDFAPAHSNLGYALARAGDSEGAIQSYRDALRFSPGDVGAHLALAEELGLAGRKQEGMTHLERAAELAPADPRIPRMRERLAK